MSLPNDISRCLNLKCPIRTNCLRFVDKGGDRTVYSIFEPKDDNTCEHQIVIDPLQALSDNAQALGLGY